MQAAISFLCQSSRFTFFAIHANTTHKKGLKYVMSQDLHVLDFIPAQEKRLPLLFDSPHSGTVYPSDFDYTIEHNILRLAEDAYVDELFRHAPKVGAGLLRALFPRSYIDPNRSTEDFDVNMVDGAWDMPTNPGSKTRQGIGLIFRDLPSRGAVYSRMLTIDEVHQRIDRYWRPYHQRIGQEINALYAQFGKVWHVNCHSMPAYSSKAAPDGAVKRAEVVLGDRHQSTCSPEFTQFIQQFFVTTGYQVKVNEPYAGVELVRRYSNPGQGRHSIQVELRRDLYMNEETLEKNPGFTKLQKDLSALCVALGDYVRQKLL